MLLLFGAANRDPTHYPEADRFLTDRDPSDHLSFGSGIHHCLGANLARLEARAVLEAMIERVHSLAFVGEARWLPNPNLRGLERLPLRLNPSHL